MITKNRVFLALGIMVILLVAGSVLVHNDQSKNSLRLAAQATPPQYVPNTPYYDMQAKAGKSDEELEEAAERDVSRMNGNAMYVAIKDHNHTEQFGFADIIPGKDGTQISIHTENSEPPLEVNQPTIIYHGTCVKHGEELMQLSPTRDGHSETAVPISITELQKQLPLAIYIYRNEGSLNEYNACGDFPVK
jgi:hypothetical protein